MQEQALVELVAVVGMAGMGAFGEHYPDVAAVALNLLELDLVGLLV